MTSQAPRHADMWAKVEKTVSKIQRTTNEHTSSCAQEAANAGVAITVTIRSPMSPSRNGRTVRGDRIFGRRGTPPVRHCVREGPCAQQIIHLRFQHCIQIVGIFRRKTTRPCPICAMTCRPCLCAMAMCKARSAASRSRNHWKKALRVRIQEAHCSLPSERMMPSAGRFTQVGQEVE